MKTSKLIFALGQLLRDSSMRNLYMVRVGDEMISVTDIVLECMHRASETRRDDEEAA